MPDTITIDRAEYEALVAERDRLREALEDAEDAAELEAAAGRRKAEGYANYLPVEAVELMLAGENPLRIWREHRGVSMTRLAAASGVAQSYISEIGTGKKPGSLGAWKAFAKALGVTVDDLTD